MKYRLTVKGQVALATLLLLVVFAAGSLNQLGKSNLKEADGTPAGTDLVSQGDPSAAPTQPTIDPAAGQPATEAAETGLTDEQLEKAVATLYFSPDQWEIKAAEIGKITEIMDILQAYPHVKIIVEGNIHGVSDTEDTAFGQELSLKRAQVAAQVLIGKGIAEDRIVIKSNGSSKPVTSEPDKVWMNRRTMIYIEGFKGSNP